MPLLVLGQHLGDDLDASHLAAHRLSGAAVVTGEQHHFQPQLLHGPYSLQAVGFGGSATAMVPMSAPSQEKNRGVLPASASWSACGAFWAAPQTGRCPPESGGPGWCPECPGRAPPQNPPPGRGESFAPGPGPQWPGPGVLLRVPPGKRPHPAAPPGCALLGQQVGDHRLALGDGAGFVQHHSFDALEGLQGLRGLKQGAVLGPGRCPP